MIGRISSISGPLSPMKVAVWMFRYFRFTVTKVRDATQDLTYPVGIMQFAELDLMLSGTRVSYSGATATNPGGSNPVGEEADKGIDGNVDTKFLDRSGNGVIGQDDFGNVRSWVFIIDFKSRRTVDGFRYCTGNDVDGRDPVRWTLEGSNDNVTWRLIHEQPVDAIITTSRKAYTPIFALKRGG